MVRKHAPRGDHSVAQASSVSPTVNLSTGRAESAAPPRYTAFHVLWSAFLYTVAVAGIAAVAVSILLAVMLP